MTLSQKFYLPIKLNIMTRSKVKLMTEQYLQNQAVTFEHPRDSRCQVWQYADNNKTQEECHLEGMVGVHIRNELLVYISSKNRDDANASVYETPAKVWPCRKEDPGVAELNLVKSI